MSKKYLIAGIAAASLALVAPVFAETSSSSTPATNANASAKIACIGTAVAAREQALDGAMTTYTASLNSAYSARATALQQAYTQTTTSAVHAAVKSAWSTFSSSARTARKTWQSARNSAWSTYRTAARACKASSSLNDSGNSGLEASGN